MGSIEGDLNFISIGDPHFRLKTQIETQELIENSVKLTKQINPTFVIILGDVIDLSGNAKNFILQQKRVVSWIEQLADICPVIVLLGNHDLYDIHEVECDRHSFQTYDNSNIFIIDDITKIKIGNKKILCVPYMPSDAFNVSVPPRLKNVDLVFAHQELKGCIMESGIKSEEGNIWESTYPLVISGHIHKRQRIGKNIIYQGTPYRVNYGESGEKVISHFVFDNNGEYKEKTYKVVEHVKERYIMSVDEVQNFKFDYSVETWLTIKDTADKLRDIKCGMLFQELKLKLKGVDFIVVDKYEKYVPKPTEKTTFEEDVISKIGKNSKLLELWTSLCSSTK